jgi:hypothetical protein
MNVKVSSDYWMSGQHDPRLGSGDIDEILKALAEFGQKVKENENPYPIYVTLEEWENIPEVRRIMEIGTRERLVPQIPKGVTTVLAKSFNTITTLFQTTSSMFEDPEWRQNIPAYFVDEQIGKRNALARILREDMRKIQSLDLTSLAQLDPSSPVFQEEYLTAYKRQREVDDLYNFRISMSAMITHGRLASSCTSERQTFSFPAFQMAVAGRGEFFLCWILSVPLKAARFQPASDWVSILNVERLAFWPM